MAPRAEDGYVPATVPDTSETAVNGHVGKSSLGNGEEVSDHVQSKKPLELKGVLEEFAYFDVTPIIGREFKDVDVVAWLQSPNSDELIRDLAITVSQRGVVFFRAQNNLTDDLQKQLVQRLGELSGKPSTSGLHIHPIANSSREHGTKDDEISVISSQTAKKVYKGSVLDTRIRSQSSKGQWHSDAGFEPVPSDYTALRLTELPKTGGDTLFASGYELFDRISPPYQKFLESLTATFSQPLFNKAAKDNDFTLYAAARGSPHNVGNSFEATHPVVRTNPVTGWKSVFAVGQHVQQVNDVAPDESKALLEWFLRLIVENHDLQARYQWQNPNDLAICDNRSVYHAATPDYEGLGERKAHRVVGIGEKSYLDPQSKSRREALAEGVGV